MRVQPWILRLFVAALVCFGSSAPVLAQCEPTVDCNANGVLDFCDIAFGTSDDCNTNGIPDECDIAVNAAVDCNLNGIPDLCEPAADTPLLVSVGIPDGGGTAVATDGEHTISGFPFDATVGLDAGAAAIHRRVGTRWIEESFLLALDASAADLFGSAVDIDGEWAAVGAPGAGVNLQDQAGAVYVYRQVLGSWIPFQKITAPAPLAGDLFGSSVGVSGSSLIVGAPQGLLGLGTGRAFLYTFDGIGWSLELDLTPGALEDGDQYGFAVSIDGPRAFVGAPQEQGLAQNNSGTIYAYQSVGGLWFANGRITSPLEQQNEHFGESLSVSGARVAVGAPGRAGNDGGVHILTQAGLAWSTEAVVIAPVAPDRFGEQISLDGESLMVGDNRANGNSGVAYIFDRNGGAWSLRETRAPAAITNGDRFGSAVALSSRTATVGASGLPGMFVLWVAAPIDCDLNGIEDICDITSGLALDCNLNGIPDNCDIASGAVADCDLDGIPDECEIADGTESDCNANGVLDLCDLAQGASDCNANSIPDDCETDCDGSGTPDDCDIAAGLALDCNANGVPDSCDVALGLAADCNGNGVPDTCDLASGFSQDCDLDGTLDDCAIADLLVPDCNLNSVPDSCDFASGTSQDCNATGIPDECDIASGLSEDCDGNLIPDECDFVAGAPDCNGNGVLDSCDILTEASPDCDGNLIPDECDLASGTLDCNGNGVPDTCDLNQGLVVDATQPTITGLPEALIVSTDPGQCGAVVQWLDPIIEDNCQLQTVTQNRNSGEFFLTGVTTVTYVAVDIHGNSRTASFSVTVRDLEPPITTGAPTDVTLSNALGTCFASASFTFPTATDNCAIASSVSSHLSGDLFPVGATIVEITTTDTSGNATIDAFTVTVVDDEPPVWSGVPDDLVLPSQPGFCSASVSWAEPTVSDGCGILSTTSDAVSGAVFALGTTLVTYTATDVAGNVGEASFSVTVEDNESPILTGLPQNLDLVSDAGDCGTIATWNEPTTLDNCAGVTLTSDFSSGAFFPVGVTTVTYTAMDTSGNETPGSFTVTVVDLEEPVFTSVPTGVTAGNDLGLCSGTPTWEAPIATDPCGIASIEANPPLGSSFPVGTSTVTLTATDLSGNTATTTFEVTVTDSEAPVIDQVPTSISIGTDPLACGAIVAFSLPSAVDNCAVASVESSHASSSMFPVGTTTVEFIATDTAGNAATATFTVTVTDLEAPDLSPSADITAPLDPTACGALVTVPAPAVTDRCGVESVLNDFTGTADASGNYPAGVTVITWTATDIAGNVATAIQTITVDFGEDCNGNGFPDACDIADGTSVDCNENGVPDSCDLAEETSSDADGDGIPDDCQALFLRGDSNGDALIDIADGIFILNFLFLAGTQGNCADTLDANDDGSIQLSDAITVFGYMFSGDAPPAAPFETCGVDPTVDTLECVLGACP